MASHKQLTMFLTDHEKLSDARDRAAYRCVGAISAAICYCRQEQPKDALSILMNALSAYEHAETKLENFKKQGANNVNLTAAA